MKKILKKLKLLISLKNVDLLFKSNLLNPVKMVMEVYLCGRKFDRGENSRLIFDIALIDFTLERF